jgi:TonB family protein
MNWWQYLLLANVYLVLFYAFYALLLRRETFFQLNRVYLVSAAILSFIIPLIQANWVQNLFITQEVHYTFYGKGIIIYGYKPVTTPVSIGEVLAYLYLAGVLFLTLRFVWQLISLNKIIKQPGQAAAFSFFKKIKLDETIDNSNIITAHEQIHAKQWHSADVLIIEAVMIINWLNPVVYFYRRAIKHIHEFIADSHALKIADNKADYAMLLLTQTFNTPSHQLANHFFNHSLLKQRIMMLQKNKSQRIALIKYGLSAPLFVLMLILSSATVNASKAITRVNIKAAQVLLTPAIPAETSSPADVPAVEQTKAASIPADTTVTTSKTIQGKLTNNVTDSKPVWRTTFSTLTSTATDKKAVWGTALTSTGGNNKMIQGTLTTTQTDTTSGNEIFSAVEQEPTFHGGINAFYKFLAKNIKYPESMRKNHISGKVIAQFIVEKDGSLSDIKVLRAPCDDAGTEAARVLALSPPWEPGIQNGRKVRVQYTVPIAFALNGQAQNTEVVPIHTSSDSSKVSVIVLDKGNEVNKPLYVLDGKIIKEGDFKTKIKPEDIYSITVLRGKSATDPYGAAGDNGVIIITTNASQNKKQ